MIDLMNQCMAIKEKYAAAVRASGEEFNIFHILKMGSKEVRLHSALLGELLSMHGSHNMGNAFLVKFIAQLKVLGKDALGSLDNFDVSRCTVDLEYSLGQVNEDYSGGGRIDLLVRDKHGHVIIIENKIYAGDQQGQLLRYCSIKSKVALLYLTIDGRMPSSYSSGDMVVGRDFACLSYKDGIRAWLVACGALEGLPSLVTSTLSQYIYLLDDLTGQSNNSKMSTEIIQEMGRDDGTIEASFLIASQLEGLKEERAKAIRRRVQDELRRYGCDCPVSEWYPNFPRIEFYPGGWKNHLIGFTDERGMLFGIKRVRSDIKPISIGDLDPKCRDEFRESDWWL